MRFVSKSSNLRVVLKPGIPGNHLSGVVAQQGVYVKFIGGIVEIKDPEIIKAMKAHPGFNSDYIAVEDEITQEVDPYEYQRQETEPTHYLTDLSTGRPTKTVQSKGKRRKLSPEIEKAIQDAGMDLAKKMLPGMVKQVLTGLKEASDAEKAVKAPKEKNNTIKEISKTESIKSEVSPIEISTGSESKLEIHPVKEVD